MRSRHALIALNTFWIGINVLGDPFSSVLLPARIVELVAPAERATLLGGVTFLALAAATLVQPVAGELSDRLAPRFGRVPFIAAFGVVAMCSAALFGVAAGIALAVAGYVAVQLAVSFAQAAQQALIPDLVDPSVRGRASGVKTFMDLGGLVAGSLVIGALAERGIPLTLAAIVALVAVTLLPTLAVSRTRPRVGAQVGRTGLRPRETAPADSPRAAGPRRVDARADRVFVCLVAARFLFLLATFAIGRFLFFYVAERLGGAPSETTAQTALLLASLGIVAAIAALPAGWAADRVRASRVMASGAIGSAVAALLLGFAATLPALLAVGAVLSVGSGCFAAANWARTAQVIPREQAARFFGIANFGTGGAMAVAGLAGVIVDVGNRAVPATGYSLLFGAAAVCFVASAILAARTDTHGPDDVDAPDHLLGA